MKPAFDVLLTKPDSLALVTDEMYGETLRTVHGQVHEGGEAVMQGVEHLGKYVFEMTKAKVEALRNGRGQLTAAIAEDVKMEVDDEDAGEKEEERV